MDQRSPFRVLRDHAGKTIAAMARESGISERSAQSLEHGGAAGGVVYRRLAARWAPEMRALGLTAEDFLAGQIVGASAPAMLRRRAR